MRKTVTLDDDLAKMLKERVHSSGQSFKQVVNESLRVGFKVAEQIRRKGSKENSAAK